MRMWPLRRDSGFAPRMALGRPRLIETRMRGEHMKRKIWIVALAIAFALAGSLIWRLDIPHWKKLDIAKVTDMPRTTLVYCADGQPAGALHGGENRIWVPLAQVPEHVQNAFIAAEDLRFYRHHGVDFYRLFGALWHDIRTMSYAQGASTITQQLIKLTHLTQTKTLSRKAQEIVLALQLERRMSKQQILEAYLNALYFGSGAYGIETASRMYFEKTSRDLTLAEGALLAGVIKSPSNYAPNRNGEKAVARRNHILETMRDNGFITAQECSEAQSEAPDLAPNRADAGQNAWYLDSVLAEAETLLLLSADEIISGGYRIATGLNADMQAEAERLFDDAAGFPENADDGTPVQASIVSMDTATGEIRALVGGRSHDVSRGLNRATQARRQPGSAFKPVSTYAAAIDAFGYLPTSIVDDTPRTFPGGYEPRNAGGSANGAVTLREALSRSLNIATVDLAEAIGTPAVRSYAARFGLPLAPQDINLSMALGSLTIGVSPAELCAAYCALSNGGTRVEAHVIRTIEDDDGNLVYSAPEPRERAVNAATAYMITDMLKTAARTGSARALAACGLPVAGKTGTVSEVGGGTRDIWTAAYTPEIAVTVWMGFDNPDAVHAMPDSASGGSYPSRMCAAFMQGISADLSGRDFTKPGSVKTALLDSVALENDLAALLSTERTPPGFTTLELFHDYDMPRRFSGNWSIPAAVLDFQLVSGKGEAPLVSFTARESSAEYLILRTTAGTTRTIATLRGEAGQKLQYVDADHNLTQPADYALLPRNALLYKEGVLLTGPQTESVHYAPGGLLNAIMGAGTAEATPAPEIREPEENQSLFS